MAKKAETSTNIIPVNLKEFRKANEIVAPRVSRGGILSLLGRKVFNVLLYHTQRLGVPGENAPDGDNSYKTLFWLPLSDLAKDAAFNSEDTALLKETLLKLQDIKIITDDAKGFSSDVLVASVKIVPGKHGKKTMLGWGLHPATEAILRNPDFYTRLSIYYLTSLRTTAGIALYENSKRYITNPSRLTRREAWEWWHDVLTGQPVGGEKPEYKYFKRDVLKPAIAEVNKTDIRVELIEHKDGRRIAELQFKVERELQGDLELPPPPIIDTKLIARITDLGIRSQEATDIFASHEELFVISTLNLLDGRIADPKLPPLSSPAAFFRTALRERYADGVKKRALSKPKELRASDAVVISPEDEAVNAAKRSALVDHDNLPDAEREAQLAEFLSQNPAYVQFVKKSKNSRVARESLATWLIKQKGVTNV